MFFYNPALLADGTWLEITRALVTASIGVCLLSGGVQGYFFTGRLPQVPRVMFLIAALFLIEGSLISDVVGAVLTGGGIFLARLTAGKDVPSPSSDPAKDEAPKPAE